MIQLGGTMEDTIAAIATAYGEGGIGIIRISGPEAKSILDKLFIPKNLEITEHIANRRLYYGNVVDKAKNQRIDEVLAVFMNGPRTYTAEDVAEIYCHGSIISLRKILDLALQHGARLAEKGEFTKRAFLNGRLDLTQAEAVIDVIRAKTEKGFHVAVDQMEGALSEKIRSLRSIIMDLLVDVTVNLDYPDEDIEELTYDALEKSLMLINDNIDRLLATADTGRIIREGLHVAIIGKPNVGKSSLMNALLKESRAIVTEIPGTTRDTIEEVLTIQDIPVRLVDTAGIRETEDVIEKIGIEKSKESFNKADLVIFMIDGSRPLSEEDFRIINHIDDNKTIVMINKTDLGQTVSDQEIKSLLPGAATIKAAIREDKGIEELEQKILSLVYGGKVKQEESLLITNVRHYNLLRSAKEASKDALDMARNREALDFIEVDIKRCWELLGEIIGDSVTEDIIDQVFERFCLGK
ncbi:tRNA uridine-5-carboxymethylaminomethyl(34) synthesis GTPase MnmE [Clostridiales bacterium BAD-6]|uniref:tRNA modification GTPase MnmE n=2 Tax=Sinanaerobacter chloroacetimidivorans TaxID=2818044 RepID=A0A8J7W0A9_9FIRM|nr:tRNA uridine-5-carboxymethylaminomethyl(34) synthesis GTPase MnmE [Sinanaerobacter chloroacetimidivorans]